MHASATIDRAFFQRIIALLMSLAGLADRAAGAPWPLRFVVLAILRRGETAARNLLIDEADYAGVPMWLPPDAGQYGNRPVDALQLGLCFRMLALALAYLLQQTAGAAQVAPRLLPFTDATPLAWLEPRVRPAHDTS